MRRGAEIILAGTAALAGSSFAAGLLVDNMPYWKSQVNGSSPLNCNLEDQDGSIPAYVQKGSLSLGSKLSFGGGRTLTGKYIPAVELVATQNGELETSKINLGTTVSSNGTEASFVSEGIRYDVFLSPGQSKEYTIYEFILSCAKRS